LNDFWTGFEIAKDKELGMAQTLISSTLSGKAVYSDSAVETALGL
jgi:hypothetical protein